MVSYYDYVLALIPLTLVAVVAVLLGSGWTVTAAVPVAGGSAGLLVGHALFVNGPAAAGPETGAPRTPPASAD